jgi:hypothetical protein
VKCFALLVLAVLASCSPVAAVDASPDAAPEASSDRVVPSLDAGADSSDAPADVPDAMVTFDVRPEASEPECTGSSTRTCYDGPAETRGRGACVAGQQTCAAGRWGECVGQVLPRAEVCGNAEDEDCDGTTTCAADAGLEASADAGDARADVASDAPVCGVNQVFCGRGCCPQFATCERDGCACGASLSACYPLPSGTPYCANLTREPSNCGACGHVCEAFRPRCVMGVCVP